MLIFNIKLKTIIKKEKKNIKLEMVSKFMV